MITTADAIEIMAIVAACHHRSAPRMDDREATMATATVWSELFEEYDFSKPELVAAVKNRAKVCPDAPEAADIIRVARTTRSDRMARMSPPQDEYPPDGEHHHGDGKAAPEPADYPADWTPEQRVNAYWYAMRLHAMPQTTAGWQAIADQLERKRAERGQETLI